MERRRWKAVGFGAEAGRKIPSGSLRMSVSRCDISVCTVQKLCFMAQSLFEGTIPCGHRLFGFTWRLSRVASPALQASHLP
jgi:hypothetical protein